jgi:hypothetical protein
MSVFLGCQAYRVQALLILSVVLIGLVEGLILMGHSGCVVWCERDLGSLMGRETQYDVLEL